MIYWIIDVEKAETSVGAESTGPYGEGVVGRGFTEADFVNSKFCELANRWIRSAFHGQTRAGRRH